jgi:hypothetical protein
LKKLGWCLISVAVAIVERLSCAVIVMSLIGTEIATAASWLGEWAIVGVAGKLVEGAVKRFKPDEMALL